MELGFTGSRLGMTAAQMTAFGEFIEKHKVAFTYFHHGDCVGSDEQAHEAVRRLCTTWLITIHPPTSDKLRAFCVGDDILTARPYLKRDDYIAECADVVVGTPHESSLKGRTGGTWYTLRSAYKKGKQVVIIFPDGKMEGFKKGEA